MKEEMDKQNRQLSQGTEKKILVAPQELRQLTSAIFSQFLKDEEIIKCLANSFVSADLVGHHTHGVASIRPYVEMTKEKRIIPKAKPRIIENNAVGTWVDGQNGYGRYAARWSMNKSIEIAKKKGKSVLWLKNTSNIGRLGEYAEQCAEEGCIGIITVGSGNNNQSIVAPPDCVKRFFGTNPIAFAFPLSEKNTPFLIDLSLSKTTYHQVEQHLHMDESLKEKSLIDKRGKLTDNPATLFEEGSIVMPGGHKGFCLSLFFTIFAGLANLEFEQKGLGGTCFIVLDGNQIKGFEIYKGQVKAFLHQCRLLKTLDGKSLRLPGDHSEKCREKYAKLGVPIPIQVWEDLKKMSSGREEL